MKTSNQLVLLIVIIFFGAIGGSAMILKQEYQKINFDDPFFGLARQQLPAFSAIELQGNYPGQIEILPGESSEFLHTPQQDFFEWEVSQDTLYLNCSSKGRARKRSSTYILAPMLSSLTSDGITCRIHNWKAPQMRVRFRGRNGFITFTDNQFGKFSAAVQDEGTLRIEKDNSFGRAKIMAGDKSNVIILSNQVDSLELQLDPQANVQLSGVLLEKL